MVTGILTERRRQADVKKRAEFQRLKEQMTADLQVGLVYKYRGGRE